MVLLAAVEASSKLEEAIRSLVEHGSQLGFTIIMKCSKGIKFF